MPFPTRRLLAFVSICVQLLALLGANNADLIILYTMLTTRVCDRVNVQTGCTRLAGEFAKSLDELFLKIVV